MIDERLRASLGEAEALSAAAVYDAALTSTLEPRVVGNDVAADGKLLLMITGANQGGKSTSCSVSGRRN